MNMNAAPLEARPNAWARMARTIAEKVEATAANWGELPKGALTKKDQLVNEKLCCI